MQRLLVLIFLSLALAEQKFIVVHPKGIEVTTKESEAKGKMVLGINQTEDKLEVVTFTRADESANLSACPIPVPSVSSLETLNSLKELLNKRKERRDLLDKKLRLLLTPEFLKKLNQLEKKHNLIYLKPITQDIDPYELYDRLVVLIAVLAH